MAGQRRALLYPAEVPAGLPPRARKCHTLSLSGPAERPTAAAAERKLHRLADGALPPDELEVLDELLPTDATEAHLRWLESGAEGPEPCDESSG